jgi:CheY-like chemotaxis protein/tetratricopeptide (TPR) repeat protein
LAGTILYVDDAPELPEGTARELSRLGYRVVHCSDPGEALELAGQGLARLILLELLLPGGGGFELLERIRGLDASRGEVPVVVLTRGGRTPKLYGRALELGVNEFLCKPVLRPELLAAVLEWAEEAGDEPAPAAPAGDRVASVEEAFRGELADNPLPELLLRLRRIGANGVLLIQNEAETRAIELRNGAPVAVGSNRGLDSLEDFLVRTKRISGDEHEEVTEQVQSELGSAREILVATGILSAAEVDEALSDRAGEPLLEGFAWTQGSHRFQMGKRLKAAQAVEIEESPARLLLKGALQWSPSREVRTLVDTRAALYVSKVQEPLYPFESLGTLGCDAGVLEGLLGDRTVAEVLESGEVEERMFYGLLVAGFVEVHPEPVLLLSDALEPVRDEATRAAPERPGRWDEPDLEVDALDSTADLDDVLADSPADTEASGAQADASPQSAASRALEAETWFRKGTGYLVRQRYEKAVEAFGMAAHLDPSQGEYSSHLGYALHLNRPRNELVRREALEHIAKGIKLAPDHWRPLVFLGRVFKAGGDLENAQRVFRRALKVQPDCRAALDELRRLNEPDRREGLLGRVRGWVSERLGRPPR